MAGSLELAKVTAAVWLHLNWARARFWMKVYMTPAVVVLMLISSMGIFGFLSKAHIQQDAVGQETQARIDRIDDELLRLNEDRERAETRIDELESGETGADAATQRQIDREQARVDAAYQRIQPGLDSQNQIIQDARSRIETETGSSLTELTELERQLSEFNDSINRGQIEQVQQDLINQGLLTGSADGILGNQTQSAIAAFRLDLESRIAVLRTAVDRTSSAQNQIIQDAQAEITRLQQAADSQVSQSLELIRSLSSQLGQTESTEIADSISEQRSSISAADIREEELLDEKFELESVIRDIEAEVGPIRYIAEMVYGSADRDVIERSVQWLILILVGVFDPLAIMMILAATGGIISAAPVRIEKEAIEDEEWSSKDRTPNFEGPEEPVLDRHVFQSVIDDDSISTLDSPVQLEEPTKPSEPEYAEPPSTPRLTPRQNESYETSEDTVIAGKGSQTTRIQAASPVARRHAIEAAADADNSKESTHASFGTIFPSDPQRGDVFLKVDAYPNRPYKWNGVKWIELEQSRIDDTLAQDDEYIEWVISQISRGAVDIDDVRPVVQDQIERLLDDTK